MKFGLVLLVVVFACSRENGADSARVQTSLPDTGQPARTPHTSDLTPPTRHTILFIGTSITAGYGLEPDSAYPIQIQRMVDSAGLGYEVVNAGVSGETSSDLLRRVDWLMRQPVDVVVIEAGANDGLRGIPVETMRANLQKVIDRVKVARPSARIALAQMEALPNLGVSYTRGFHDVFPDLAARNGVVLVPFLLTDVAGERELNQADGIHPNYKGERIVARNVWKALRPMLQ